MTMKKLILMVLLCATPAAANEGHICQHLGELAESIMTLRQSGMPMSKLMGVLPEIDVEMREFMRLSITKAYDEPLYGSDKYQARAVVEFRDKVEIACFKSKLGR